jgi:hypothetical protein
MDNAFSWAFILSTTEDFDFLTTEEKDLLFKYYEECKAFSDLGKVGPHTKDETEKAFNFLVDDLTREFKNGQTGHGVLIKVMNTKTLIEFIRFRFPILDNHYETIYQEELELFLDFYLLNAKKGVNHSKLLEQAHEKFATESPILRCQRLNRVSSNKIYEVLQNVSMYSSSLDKILGSQKPSTMEELDNPFSKDLSELTRDYDQTLESYIQILSDERYEASDEYMKEFLEKYTSILIDAYHNEAFHNTIDNYIPKDEILNSKEYTLNRQVIAINLLLASAGCANLDNIVKAKFIQFLTAKNLNTDKIKNTEIYTKLIANSLNKKDKEFLIKQFEPLKRDEFMYKLKEL